MGSEWSCDSCPQFQINVKSSARRDYDNTYLSVLRITRLRLDRALESGSTPTVGLREVMTETDRSDLYRVIWNY